MRLVSYENVVALVVRFGPSLGGSGRDNISMSLSFRGGNEKFTACQKEHSRIVMGLSFNCKSYGELD